VINFQVYFKAFFKRKLLLHRILISDEIYEISERWIAGGGILRKIPMNKQKVRENDIVKMDILSDVSDSTSASFCDRLEK
jgi:hypothetical protein